jgi:hypothetical protein
MTNLSTEQINTFAEAIDALITTDVSPYRLAEVTSQVIGRQVRPQVVYSYVRQGFIKAHKNDLGKWVVARDVAVAWSLKYVTNNFGK